MCADVTTVCLFDVHEENGNIFPLDIWESSVFIGFLILCHVKDWAVRTKIMSFWS